MVLGQNLHFLKAFGRLAKTFETHQPPLMKWHWKVEFCTKTEILLILNLGQYLAKVIFHVREALAHRPRHLLAQRKAFLDTFDQWAKTKNLVLYSTWGFFWRRMTFPDFSHFLWFSSLRKWPNLGRKAFCINLGPNVGQVDTFGPKESYLIIFGRLTKTFDTP